jgi:hypothetical protein
MSSWKRIFDLCFGGGIIVAFLAGLLAATKRSLDIYILDGIYVQSDDRGRCVGEALPMGHFPIEHWRFSGGIQRIAVQSFCGFLFGSMLCPDPT